MNYIGEHLWPGQLGNFFLLLSLTASIIACFAYYKSMTGLQPTLKLRWKKLARVAFLIEVFSVFSILILLFFILHNHLFEYKYAWQHSSLSLETKYLFASLWEGQEGSFLLWSFWHCCLGLILIWKAKSWEAPIMTILSLSQICLATMVSGVMFFGHKIGSNPFVLLRNELDAPIFSNPAYLSMITDGNDLNPLLQNYWMVIHPPVLFLGFACAIVPFAYAIAGLWTKRYSDWVKPALPWTLISVAILGSGIIMGARWAYESLTFGGYWAWDPVENASLVPWLILVAGIHSLIIFKHTGHSLRTCFLFFILSYLFILYSTFLTRSGILGDSSVHAFTDLGLNTQILLFLLIFLVPSVLLLILRYKYIPKKIKEEKFSSREFWMFIGSVILFLSALSIIVMTSIPVFNKLASFFTGNDKTFTPLAIGEDSEYTYNKVQIWVAIFIGLLTAFVQYLKFRGSSWKYLWKKLALPTVITVILSALIFIYGNIDFVKQGRLYHILIWVAVVSSIYSFIANVLYIRTGYKGKLLFSGSAISHSGFAILLLGILFSASNKQVLSASYDPLAPDILKGSVENERENLTLIKGIRTSMDKYWVTYQSDSVHPGKPLWYYKIFFEEKQGDRTFTLLPNAFVNYKGNQGLMSNPAARHALDHDLFIYITSLPDPAQDGAPRFKEFELNRGDTVRHNNVLLILESIKMKTGLSVAGLVPGDSAFIAEVEVYSDDQQFHLANPILVRRESQVYNLPDTLHQSGLILQLNGMKNGKAQIGIAEKEQTLQFATIKVYKFPFIALIWLGSAILVLGLIISSVNRIRKQKTSAFVVKTSLKKQLEKVQS